MGTRRHPRQLHLSRVHADSSVSVDRSLFSTAHLSPFVKPEMLIPALIYSTEKIMNENPDLRDKWISLIPQGKMGRPEDLMGPVAFLLSPASSYITGADFRVDGGYTIT